MKQPLENMDTGHKAGTRRVRHLDLAAGILIIWVITFHALGNAKVFGDVDARVAVPFLTFSMPWFFYKSGTFFNGKRGKEGTRRDIGKLLIPYLKWSALGFAAYLVIMAVDRTFTLKDCLLKPLDTLWIYGYIPLDVPIWFLLSLFAVKCLATLASKAKVHPVPLVIAGFSIASLFHVIGNPRIPVWLSNIPMGLSFFMLGHLLHRYEHKCWLFIPCLAGYIAFLIFRTPVVGLHRNVHLDGNYYLWPVFSICGIIAFNNICRLACNALDKIPAFRFRPISFLGRHSITLLVSHAFVYWPAIHFSTLSPVRTFLIIEAVYFIVLIPVIYLRHKATESTTHTI